MSMETLRDLLEDQIKDLYSAETQLVKALPGMARKASSEPLREAIEEHLEETKNQVERLQKISEMLDSKATGKKCKGMEGLIAEGKEEMQEDGEDPILDAAIIAAAQRVEHYEISAYGTARAIAQQLGEDEVAELLQETLEEESAANEKLTELAESEIYPNCATGAEEDEEGEEDMEEEPVSASRTKSKKATRSSR